MTIMKSLKIMGILMLLVNISYAQTPYESLNYLYSIQGNYTVGGIHNRQPISNPNQYSTQLNGILGDWPGLYGSDFMFEYNEIDDRQTMINQVITEWNNGAMINLMWHACNPAGGEPCNWDSNSADVKSYLNNTQWNNLLTNGTTINNNWKAMMDEIATFLQQLEDAGVEVFFRPLHEMNQGAFWWGGRPGSGGSAALYRLTHDYLTYTKGLSNLIWVWNLQDFGSFTSDLNNYDPGASYWDVLTMDMYWSDGSGYTSVKYNAMVNKANGKPIGIGECQDLPAVNLLSQQPLWTFFMGWSELVFSGNSNQKIQDIYWSGRVRVLDEMPGWNGTGSWQNGGGGPQYIQAEDYDNMSGIQTETTSDPDGGNLNVGWVDSGDWLTYNDINIPASGNYSIAYRVASQSGGGTIQLEQAGGGTIYGSINVPSTGGWQTWTTIYQTVYLNAGSQSFGIKATSGGWNLNWWAITPSGGSRTTESFDEAVLTETSLAYPNPFTSSVSIPLIEWDGQAEFLVRIFDVSGSVINTMDQSSITAGKQVVWDGRNSSGSIVPSGVYYYQFQAGRQAASGKVIKE